MVDQTWAEKITETDPAFLAQEYTRLEARASLLFGIAADAIGSPLKVMELLQKAEANLKEQQSDALSIKTHAARKR